MKLSKEEVRHLAILARVGMTDEDIEKLQGQLSNILDNFQVLQEVDTSSVQPTGHAANVNTVMREDEPRPSAPKEDVLANAPRREDDFVRVKAVLE